MTDTEITGLRPANENPWYCLATLHGEQPSGRWDKELAEKNRSAWSQWFGDITQSQRTEIVNSFIQRSGRSGSPPDATAKIDFYRTHFESAVDFRGFVFTRRADFGAAKFSETASFEGAVFNDSANFERAVFSDVVTFESAYLNKTNFRSVTFSGTTTFRSANFVDFADFQSATFADIATYNSATFSRVSFKSARIRRFCQLPRNKVFWDGRFCIGDILKSCQFSVGGVL